MRQRGRKSIHATLAVNVNGDPPRLTPPSHLDASERRLFSELIEACAPQHFTKSDLPLLSAYVQSILLSRSAIKRIGKDPTALALWEKSTRMLATLATRLRLAPQARVDPKSITRMQPHGFKRPWEIGRPWDDDDDLEEAKQ